MGSTLSPGLRRAQWVAVVLCTLAIALNYIDRSTLANWFHPKDRGRPTGLYTVGGDLGRIVGTPLLTALLLAFGWRAMFVVMGVVGVLAAGAWMALYRNPDPARMTEADRAYLRDSGIGQARPAVTVREWRQLFRFRSMWGMILGAFCSGYAIWMYGTWLPGYLEMQHHVSIARTGFLAMIPLACSIVGSIAGGYATDRLAHRGMGLVASRKLPAAAGYVAAALFCAVAAAGGGLGVALTCISASMFFLSFAQSGKWTLITAIAPERYAASVSSIQNFGSYIGGTVSPLVTGMVVDATGSFALALALGACIMIMAALLYSLAVRDPISLAGLSTGSLVMGPGVP